jgi:hypothetical protein
LREKPVEVQDFRKITNQFGGIHGIFLTSMTENRKDNKISLVWYRFGLGNTRLLTAHAPKISPDIVGYYGGT